MTAMRIGPYVVERELGSGGMGTVYLARSRGGRAVAVKVARPEPAVDPAFRARFRVEIEAARRVGGFHTAPVVDAEPDGAPPSLAGDRVRSRTHPRCPAGDRRAHGGGNGEAARGRTRGGSAGHPRVRTRPPRPEAGQHRHGRRRPQPRRGGRGGCPAPGRHHRDRVLMGGDRRRDHDRHGSRPDPRSDRADGRGRVLLRGCQGPRPASPQGVVAPDGPGPRTPSRRLGPEGAGIGPTATARTPGQAVAPSPHGPHAGVPHAAAAG